jgi:hypothetical protein
MWMNINENSKNNKHNFGTSTSYRHIHILTGAPEGVTKAKAPLYHKKSIPHCADVVFYSRSLLTDIGKGKPVVMTILKLAG